MRQEETSTGNFGLRSFWMIAVYLLVAVLGLPKLQVDSYYHAYFDKSDPLVVLQQQLDQRYESLDQLLLLVAAEPADRQSDGHEFVGLIRQLDGALSDVSGVAHVQSLADLQLHDSDEQGLLAAMQELEPDIQLAALPGAGIDDFEDHPFAHKVLLSSSGRASILELRLAGTRNVSAEQLLQTLQRIRTVVDSTLAKQQTSYSYAFSGPLALNEAYIETIRHDLKVFIPSMLMLFLLIPYVFFRSARVALLLLAAPLLSTVAAFGLAGFTGVKLAAINAFVPVMITSIGVAGAVHIAFAYCQALQDGATPAAAKRISRAHNQVPLLLASLSTTLGFLVLSFSPSPPLRVVGYIVASGIMLNYALLMLLLPGWLERTVRSSKGNFSQRFHIGGLTSFIHQRHRSIRQAGLVLGLAGLAVVPMLQINDNVFEYFSNDHPFRLAADQVDSSFSGINVLQYELDSGEENGIFRPDFFNFTERTVRYLQEQPETRNVHAYTQWLQWRADQSQRSSSTLLANYSALASEQSSPGQATQPLLPAAAERYVAKDLSAARLLVFLPQLKSADIMAFDRRVNAWLDAESSDFSSRGAAGPALTFAHLGARNAHSMMLSLIGALVLISLFCGVWLKSWRVAIAALSCNALPIILVYGVWAALGGDINLGSAVVMGMIMGILVDDSIYLLSAHHQASSNDAANPLHAMLRQVAPALIITTITLSAGLMLGLASDFQPITAMAGLSAAVIVLALLADLYLLPAILRLEHVASRQAHG